MIVRCVGEQDDASIMITAAHRINALACCFAIEENVEARKAVRLEREVYLL